MLARKGNSVVAALAAAGLLLSAAPAAAAGPVFRTVGGPGVGGPIREAQELFPAAVPASAARAWRTMIDPQTGFATALLGGESPAFAGTPDEAALAFLEEAAPVLGIAAPRRDLALRRQSTLEDTTALRYAQRHGAARVVGGEVVVALRPGGRVASVVSSFRQRVDPLNAVRLTATEAEAAARAAIAADPAAGRPVGDAAVELLLRPEGAGHRHLWEVSVATEGPPGLQRAWIDAESGEISTRFDANTRFVNGRGIVYRNDRAAQRNDWSRVPLRNLTPVDGGNGLGRLFGQYCLTYDLKNRYAERENLHFNFNPLVLKDKFDQVQAYYHVNGAAEWFRNRFGFSHPGQIKVEARVNAVLPECNSWFSGNVDGYGHTGMVFGDDTSCHGLDEVRSADIVYHEYAHGVSYWAGLPVQGRENHYSRTVGEALADYFAATRFGNPKMFEYAWRGGERTLANRKRYPDDMGDPVWSLVYGDPYPEEHYTSQILSGFLWDVRAALKFSSGDKYRWGDRLIFQAVHTKLTDLPNSAYVGETDFYDVLYALLLQFAEGDAWDLQKVYGHAASRGLMSKDTFVGYSKNDANVQYWADQRAMIVFFLNRSAVEAKLLPVKFDAEVLRRGDRNDFYLMNFDNVPLTFKITARRRGSGGGLKPTFTVRDDCGGGSCPHVSESSRHPSAELAVSRFTVPAMTRIRVSVRGRDGTTGKYRLNANIIL